MVSINLNKDIWFMDMFICVIMVKVLIKVINILSVV